MHIYQLIQKVLHRCITGPENKKNKKDFFSKKIKDNRLHCEEIRVSNKTSCYLNKIDDKTEDFAQSCKHISMSQLLVSPHFDKYASQSAFVQFPRGDLDVTRNLPEHGRSAFVKLPSGNLVKDKQKRNHGSATIEAVCLMPVLIFVFLAFYMMGQIIIMENQIYQAARNTADYLAECAYIEELWMENQEIPVSEQTKNLSLGEQMLGLGAANISFQQYLGDNAFAERYVQGGKQGILLWSDSLLDEEGFIDFVVLYRIRVSLPFLHPFSKIIRIPIRQKAYIGYISNGAEAVEDETYVYMTEYGRVYHTTRSCTHLQLSIQPVTEAVRKMEYGGLRPCEYCGAQPAEVYYITDYGDCYHTSIHCSGLKRTIYRVRLRDVGGVPACSDCGG